ncbi:hypothetical protein RUM44_011829 [Polyplax serrata]|uniref:Uncharacterized protein n=1 Tax=Polyplax serrata TaxID=468196 RepID=A0ABR1B9K0_POLSC
MSNVSTLKLICSGEVENIPKGVKFSYYNKLLSLPISESSCLRQSFRRVVDSALCIPWVYDRSQRSRNPGFTVPRTNVKENLAPLKDPGEDYNSANLRLSSFYTVPFLVSLVQKRKTVVKKQIHRSNLWIFKMFCGKKSENCAFVSGVSFILFGLFLLLFWEETQEKIVSQKFRLSRTSKTYEPWIKSRVPIYVQYYFFNWTNPTDLKDANYKPQLTEVGPYKFWERIEKVNVTWNKNGTVSYQRLRKWYFDPVGSKGRLTDKITTINVIALMAANMGKPMPLFGKVFMGIMISITQKILVTKTVSELLFEGYIDPLLSAGRGWPSTSSKVPYDKFGWFYKRNGSTTFDGIYNVQTGENGMEHFGAVALWNFKNQTSFYEGNCGQVKGSGGEYWPWKRRRETDIYLFSSDLCRYIQYKYSEKVKVSDVNGFKYVADADLFDNGTSDPSNKCFCNGQCLPSGVLNISLCRFGAPVFTSYPHFYQADPTYLNAFVGLKPNRILHENFIALEPTYGIPLEIAARIQINVLVKPNSDIALLEGVKQLIFPIFWLDQRVFVPAERLSEIKLLLYLPTIMFILSIVFLLIGASCLLTITHRRAEKRHGAVGVNQFKSTDDKILQRKNLDSEIEEEKSLPSSTIKSVPILETDL